MSSENQQRFESLQREFSAYAEHVMTQAPKPKSKSKPKQESVAVAPPSSSPDAVSTATPRKRGRKPKSDEAVNATPIVC